MVNLSYLKSMSYEFASYLKSMSYELTFLLLFRDLADILNMEILASMMTGILIGMGMFTATIIKVVVFSHKGK